MPAGERSFEFEWPFDEFAFEPEKMKGNICIFASARNVTSGLMRQAYRLGDSIARRNLGIVYGGTDSGLMHEVALGVLSNGGRVTSVLPVANLWQTENFGSNDVPLGPTSADSVREVQLSPQEKLVLTGSLEQRKRSMLDLSDAVIALPGGVGTFDEIATTFEMGRGYAMRGAESRVALVNTDGYYEGIRFMLDVMNRYRTADGPSQDFAYFADDAQQALDYVCTQIESSANEGI